VETSELIAAREQLISRRNRLIKDLRSRREAWVEFHQVCRDIVDLNNKLGEGVTDDERDSAE
jgi:hypothetical protein